jgi:hypothetical protein
VTGVRSRIRVADRRERHPADPVRERVRQVFGRPESEPRLSRAAWPCHGPQPNVLACHEFGQPLQLGRTTEKRRRLRRQVRPVQTPQRRERLLAQLEQALRLVDVLQPCSPRLRSGKQSSTSAAVACERTTCPP